MMSAGLITHAVLIALMLGVAIIDWRLMIIPDAINAAILAVGLTASFGFGQVSPVSAGAAMVLGGGLLLGVQAAFRARRGCEGLGTGDVKLMAAGGTWTGIEGLAPSLLIACLCALACLGCLRAAGIGFGREGRIPFGPFLGLGIVVSAVVPPGLGASWLDLLAWPPG